MGLVEKGEIVDDDARAGGRESVDSGDHVAATCWAIESEFRARGEVVNDLEHRSSLACSGARLEHLNLRGQIAARLRRGHAIDAVRDHADRDTSAADTEVQSRLIREKDRITLGENGAGARAWRHRGVDGVHEAETRDALETEDREPPLDEEESRALERRLEPHSTQPREFRTTCPGNA